MPDEHARRSRVAWRIEFSRDRFTPAYARETIWIVADDGAVQALQDTLRELRPDAIINKADRLGTALVAE